MYIKFVSGTTPIITKKIKIYIILLSQDIIYTSMYMHPIHIIYKPLSCQSTGSSSAASISGTIKLGDYLKNIQYIQVEENKKLLRAKNYL